MVSLILTPILLAQLFIVTYCSTDCAYYGHCNTCTNAGSWLSGCRWCPVDNRCHATGSLFNPCSTDQNIKNADDCSIEPLQTSFNLDTAWRMLLYSHLAYSDIPSSADYYSKLPSTFHLNQTYLYWINPNEDETKVFAFLGYDTAEKHIIISFRGTQGFEQFFDEWKYDGSIPWTSYPNVEVVQYFVAATMGLVSTLYAEDTSIYYNLIDLKKQFPDYKIWITGHSLGGAMATITSVDLLINVPTMTNGVIEKDDIVLYTFGQPRTGNYAFANLVESLISVDNRFRIVNNADTVPHVPGCVKKYVNGTNTWNCLEEGNNNEFAAYHFATEIWFPEGEYLNDIMCGYRECIYEPFGEDVSCGNGLYPYYTYSVLDHLMNAWPYSYKKPLTYGFCNGLKKLNILRNVSSAKALLQVWTVVGVITAILKVI